MVWYGMVWYGMVWYGMVWYGMVWYDMVLVDRLHGGNFNRKCWRIQMAKKKHDRRQSNLWREKMVDKRRLKSRLDIVAI